MADEDTTGRYTLEEAARELARRECGGHGHDFEMIVVFGGEPTGIICARCGRSWRIVP
jgi:hypothetical protein